MNKTINQFHVSPSDAKRNAILEAAVSVFMTYGFSKVTMDDIANAAGISRPALYQFFKNKHEIFSGGLEGWCQVSLETIRVEATRPGKANDRLFKMIKLGIFQPMEEMDKTPHGKELLELKSSISKDVLNSYLEKVSVFIEAVFQNAIEQAEGEGAQFDPKMLAANFLYWMEGMKVQVDDPSQREKLLKNHIDVQFAAIASA